MSSNNTITSNNSIYYPTIDYTNNTYSDLVGKNVTVTGWVNNNTKTIKILQIREGSVPNTGTEKQHQLLGIFFDSSVPTSYVFDNALSNTLSGYAPFTTKNFDYLNFVNPNSNYGDTFGVGLYDYYTALFKGFIKLPDSYPTGYYTFVMGHDDGAGFYFDGIPQIVAPGAYDYTEHQVTLYLEKEKYYNIALSYQENGGEAELGLFWIKPDGSREFVPQTALFH